MHAAFFFFLKFPPLKTGMRPTCDIFFTRTIQRHYLSGASSNLHCVAFMTDGLLSMKYLQVQVHIAALYGTVTFPQNDQSDKDLPAIGLPVEEGRNFFWGKTREAYNYIYNHYNGSYDWVMKADDDTYVIVENLRDLLRNYDPNEPIYFGCHFTGYIPAGYMAGGAGYVLSREAMRRLVVEGVGKKICYLQNNGGNEDGQLGICLDKLGVKALDSRDHLGLHRFVQFPPAYVLDPTPDDRFWYWDVLYHHTQKGPNSCSDTAISFHYVGPSDMYVFDYFLYHLRPIRSGSAVSGNNSTQNVTATPGDH